MTDSKELFKNEHVKIYYDDELEAIFMKYLTKITKHEQVLEANEQLLKAIKKSGAHKFAVDIRNVGVMPLKSQKHVADEFFPAVVEAAKGKHVYHAQLLNKADAFETYAISSINKKSEVVGNLLEVASFSDIDDLKSYLADK